MTSQFTFDPINKVVGVIDDARDVEDALLACRNAGFATDEIELLTDEDGAQRIDANGVMVHVFLSTQRVPAFYDAPVIASRIEQELRAGHHLLGVTAKDGDARERAREILKSHGGHFINFYGRWAAEALDR